IGFRSRRVFQDRQARLSSWRGACPIWTPDRFRQANHSSLIGVAETGVIIDFLCFWYWPLPCKSAIFLLVPQGPPQRTRQPSERRGVFPVRPLAARREPRSPRGSAAAISLRRGTERQRARMIE